MKDLKENRLNLNIPTTEEEVDFHLSAKRYMEIYSDMAEVFMKHNLTIDEGIEFLELMWATSHEFKHQGFDTLQETMNYEGD